MVSAGVRSVKDVRTLFSSHSDFHNLRLTQCSGSVPGPATPPQVTAEIKTGDLGFPCLPFPDEWHLHSSMTQVRNPRVTLSLVLHLRPIHHSVYLERGLSDLAMTRLHHHLPHLSCCCVRVIISSSASLWPPRLHFQSSRCSRKMKYNHAAPIKILQRPLVSFRV